MSPQKIHPSQSGYSVIELLVAMSIMLAVMGVAFTFARDSIKTSMMTFELTDAQGGVRAAQEYINRDLIEAGDGLDGINNIRVPRNFVANYLSTNPVTDPDNINIVNLALITSDNNVPANTPVRGTAQAVTVRTNPNPTDRLTILQADEMTPIALAANAIVPDGLTMTLAAADINRFSVGDVVFLTSSVGATFATVTARNVNARTLTFGAGDTYGLNQPVDGGSIDFVSGNGTRPTSLMRMQIIQYFVNSNGLLIRRVIGVPGGIGHRDSVIAEHVTDMQFKYALNLRTANGSMQQPVAQLVNETQQVSVRQVETTIGVETTHVMNKNKKPIINMTTSTSVRMMQFRQALQPTANGG